MFKYKFILGFIILTYLQHGVYGRCPPSFSNYMNEHGEFCYRYDRIPQNWLTAYQQCSIESSNSALVQLSSIDQWNSIMSAHIDSPVSVWVGAQNFAIDNLWRWIDGSFVDQSIVKWCSRDITIPSRNKIRCAAFNSTSKCLQALDCNELLPAICTPTAQHQESAPIVRSARVARQTSTSICPNSYTGAYANWWSNSMLLLNWFILFSFVNHLTGRVKFNKRVLISVIVMVVVAFAMIICFTVFWGIQYNDLVLYPVLMTILASISALLLIVTIVLLSSNPIHIRRWKFCLVTGIIVLVIDIGLMLGLILSVSHCSGYVSLVSTSLGKDLIAAILSGMIASISVLLTNGVLLFLGNQEHASDLAAAPLISIRRIERSTSPVDSRVLNQFYSDQPRDIHSYQVAGRQYRVYESKKFTDLEQYRDDLTRAVTARQRQPLRQAIQRARSSIYATELTNEINEAENIFKNL